MVEIKIDSNSSEQRLDRFLIKLLPLAGKSLLQKSIRNKNITINKKKATPNTILKADDTIQIYFSDETFKKFTGKQKEITVPKEFTSLVNEPLYEDENFLVVDKPVNLLTQPDKTGDISLSEIIKIKISDEGTFKSAPLNRLDRNTTGIVIFPKNYAIQKTAAEAIRERRSEKIYHTVVKGIINEPGHLEDLFSKDYKNNLVDLSSGKESVSLDYKPLKTNGELTLLEIKLHTGKTHQIRSQLANIGHPVIGDPKYGDKEINKYFKKNFNIHSQLLNAYHYELFDKSGDIILNVTSQDPEIFKKVLA